MPKTAKSLERTLNAEGHGVIAKGDPGMEELPFMQLGVKIFELSEFIDDKNNVHQAIKNMLRSIRVLTGSGNRKEHPSNT